jgi:hypothetical protein
MKFNSYIVDFEHRETSLTRNLSFSGKTVSANFKKIGHDLFHMQFKNQETFTFQEKIGLPKGDKEITVLLPYLSKFNKRKLIKLSKILDKSKPGGREKYTILSSLTSVDKFLRVDELLDFFSLDRQDAVAFLVDMEVKEKIKIINYSHLLVTSYEHYHHYLEMLNALFTESYAGTNQVLKFAEIESKIKLPQSSLFFKYLLRFLAAGYSYRIRKDRLVFKKAALSENEKESLVEISDILKKNKLSVFSIEDVLKVSGLTHRDVNNSLWILVDRGEVVQLNDRYFIFAGDLHKILNRLKKYKRNQGEMIDIKAFRELTLFTRKYIIALFEYFDSQKITERVENQRKILLGV